MNLRNPSAPAVDGLIERLQSRLNSHATVATREWWTKYLRGAASFRGGYQQALGAAVLTLHGKGVKRWLSHAGRGDAVAASMKAAAGHSGVVFGERAEETDGAYAYCDGYSKVELY